MCAAAACIVAYSIQADVYWLPIQELRHGPSRRLALALFLAQKAPVLVAGFIYWTLHRTVVATNSTAVVWGSTWVIGLLLAFGFAVQAIALGMVVARSNSQRYYADLSVEGRPVVGERIWTATLAAQAIALLLLMGNAFQMYVQKPARMAFDKQRELRAFLVAALAALTLLFLRTIFRAASTVFAANHAYDATQDDGTTKPSNTGEGSTYARLVWYNFGLDGLPVLLALGLLCVMPAPRVLPSRLHVLSSTSVHHARPAVRVSASFDAARPRTRPHATSVSPAPTAPLPSIELREQALVAGEQPDVRDQPPAYDAAPAYEERPSTEGATAAAGNERGGTRPV